MISFSFMIQSLIYLGILYGSVSARFVSFRISRGTRYKGSDTVFGWDFWAGILASGWVIAFTAVEVSPILLIFSVAEESANRFIPAVHCLGHSLLRMRKAYRGQGPITRGGIREVASLILSVIIVE